MPPEPLCAWWLTWLCSLTLCRWNWEMYAFGLQTAKIAYVWWRYTRLQTIYKCVRANSTGGTPELLQQWERNKHINVTRVICSVLSVFYIPLLPKCCSVWCSLTFLYLLLFFVLFFLFTQEKCHVFVFLFYFHLFFSYDRRERLHITQPETVTSLCVRCFCFLLRILFFFGLFFYFVFTIVAKRVL